MILPESSRHDLAVPLERFAGAIAHFGRGLSVGLVSRVRGLGHSAQHDRFGDVKCGQRGLGNIESG